MSNKVTRLFPLFRSEAQLQLLAVLYAPTAGELSVSALARRIGEPQATVSRELARLEDFGVVTSRMVGRTRLVYANWAQPWATDLARLLAKTAGLPAALAVALGPLPGVDDAFIFGSWAARFEGEPGDPPRDVDVVVIGDADIDDVRDVCQSLEADAGAEINAVVVTAARWRAPKAADGFVREVKARALVAIPFPVVV